MANTTGYMGFKHIGFMPGSAPDYQLKASTIAASNATAICRGDAVVYSSGTIVRAESTNVDGIFDGCQYTDSSGQTKWSPSCPASQTATAYVLSAPGAMFLAQSNGTAISTTNINKNIGFVVGTGQTTGGGFSLYQLDAATISSNSTASVLPFRIIALWSTFQPTVNGSDNTSNNNMAVVAFNNMDFKAGVTGQ